jgi:hypothetical protein
MVWVQPPVDCLRAALARPDYYFVFPQMLCPDSGGFYSSILKFLLVHHDGQLP